VTRALDELVAQLAAWMHEHHGHAATFTRGATEAELTAVEQRLGVTLPDGLRALYRWSGGGTDEGPTVMNNRYIEPLGTLVSTREMMNGFVEDGTFDRKDWWHRSWVPFLHNGAGSYLCWDPKGSFAEAGGVPGQVIEFWGKDPERNMMTPSFDAWLTVFVDSFAQGIWKYDPEGEGVEDDGRFNQFIARRYGTYPKNAIAVDGKKAPAASGVPWATADLTKPVRDYSASSTFTLGERIKHPRFGEGVVQAVNAPGKVTIQFADQRRVLVAKR
jgi:cell wall assembly regulator SMI1